MRILNLFFNLVKSHKSLINKSKWYKEVKWSGGVGRLGQHDMMATCGSPRGAIYLKAQTATESKAYINKTKKYRKMNKNRKFSKNNSKIPKLSTIPENTKIFKKPNPQYIFPILGYGSLFFPFFIRTPLCYYSMCVPMWLSN